MFLILIFSNIANTVVESRSACPQGETVINEIIVDKNIKLTSCGIGSRLESIMAQIEEKTIEIFAADGAFKEYKTTIRDKKIILQEGISLKGKFMPLFEITIFCRKNKCRSQYSQCFKIPSNIPLYDLGMIKDQKAEQVENQLTLLLLAALSGDQKAKSFYLEKPTSFSHHFSSASFSEEYMTFKEDIEKAVKLKCIQ